MMPIRDIKEYLIIMGHSNIEEKIRIIEDFCRDITAEELVLLAEFWEN